ncbi:uncharacterized protein [Physcomitrium patens]|uniref:Uncharacterized protein n=1 Tax=Physcomitrium patens TaxID=3218 RepID=A0A2K1LAQ3_PHYPA|nr:uncharacterized protein LOC112279080 [Physcomitrium patens]XP_024368967.1 uncharacterized protein LOC112279080 [Physcomitrium patens]XP_024368975.1 uncharacterized protein LOC112279080 [Physcomitrium patens]PNR63109.1 hypothetical protein PHYPA_001534 [Physcomitrium patens]|eukprot:XP_024368959.1 uncharacterized protein LOC112279080 [Physcomitrella patens]
MATVDDSFRAVILMLMLTTLATSTQQPGPKLGFFNYSGMQAIICCMDHPAKTLEAGDTVSIPLTRSDQACIVTLKDGEHATAVIDKVLPSLHNLGHSVSVDINDTFLFFALDDTQYHQYVNFLDSQDKQIPIQRSSDLQLWTMEETMND